MVSIEPTDKQSRIRLALENKSCDELRVLAKTVAIPGISGLRKSELVDRIAASDNSALIRTLFPTWWGKHHNHVYGIIGIVGFVFSIVFYFWPWASTENSPPNPLGVIGRSSRLVTSSETPIRFADFAALTPDERTAFLNTYRGKPAAWEGFLSSTVGFEVHTQSGPPLDSPVGLRITPARGTFPQITVECDLGELGEGDYGYETRIRLDRLSIGQRLRITGKLGGNGDQPVLSDAYLEAEWPPDE